MDNNEYFLKLTREFERLYQQKYKNNNYSAYYIYKVDKYFEKYMYEIDLIRKIRNLLSHQREINHKDSFIVNKNIIDSLIKITNLISLPLDAYSISKKNVVVARKDDSLYDLVKKMFQKGLSYVPIIDNEETIGMLSSAGIINYLIQNPTQNIGNLVIGDVIEALALTRHPSKYFQFVSPSTHVSDLKLMFQKIKYGKKLALILVTSNGLNTNKIIGVITPIDLVEN